jgi:8-oxo-dGTP pyrophosphatase MutT (NUDIX family)
MQLPKVLAGVFFHPDLDELKKAFYKKFTIVLAAGGLVKNEKGEVLLIHRRGKWDLPKGKLDKGEKLGDCALREVEEETGLKGMKLGKLLLVTYHTYQEGARFILKESHWFHMTVTGNQELVPQVEEDIHDIKWVKVSALPAYFDECFPSVVDVLKAAEG